MTKTSIPAIPCGANIGARFNDAATAGAGFAPQLALASDTFRALLDASDAARDRFNNAPNDLEATDPAQHEREMTMLCAAGRAADKAIPTDWKEYTRLIEHMTDNGCSQIDDDNATRLLDHARRLTDTKPAPEGVSPGFALALRAYANADRQSAEYHASAYEPARQRYLAAREAMPHTVLAPVSGSDVAPTFWATDNLEAMAVARTLVATSPRTSTNPDHKQARNLVAADHRRNREIRAAGKSSGIDACRAESDRLGNLACDAANAVRDYPVATLADLEAKLAFMVDQAGQDASDMALVLADTRQLNGKGDR